MFLPLGDDVNKRDFPFVGALLIGINFFVYCYEVRLYVQAYEFMQQFHSAPESAQREAFKQTDYYKFIRTWGSLPDNVAKGHVMCMLTSTFLHADFFHLLGNMVVLWAFVGTLENSLGAARFFFMYIFWGVGASLIDVWANWSGDIPSIGASGAIAGMIGAYFVAFGALTRIKSLLWIIVPIKVVNIPAAFFVLFWIFTQLSGLDDAQKYGMSSVAWWAHIGGFGVGALSMLAFRAEIRSRMYRDKAGNLHMKSEEEAIAEDEEYARRQAAATMAAAEDESEPAAPAPILCPYCNVVVPEESKIHDTLLRCPSCNNLIMRS